MYILFVKELERCDECAICEALLPKFITEHEGELRVSEHRFVSDAEIKASIYAVIDACPINNIRMRKV